MTERMPGVRSVAVGLWSQVGARDERDVESGASHFLEHLLFKGTATRSASDVAEAVDEVGGDLNAFTTKEYTAFEVRLLAEHLELGLDVLCDLFWAPAFRHDDVETEREVILEEILAASDEPAELVHDHLAAALFPRHPLGRPILGTAGSVRALDRETIAAFHEAHYRPGRVVVAAAGAVDHDRLVDAIAARTPDGRGEPPPLDRAPRPVAAGACSSDERDIEQVHVALGVAGLHRAHPDRYALDVLVHVLGGGLSSRLFQEVRERRGLAYEVYASRGSFEGAGIVSLYAATSPRNTRAVLDLFREQLADLAERGVSSRELVLAKSNIRASLLLGLEDTGGRMGRIARARVALGAVPTVDEVLARYDAVGADDVAGLAASLFTVEPSLAVIGPEAGRVRA